MTRRPLFPDAWPTNPRLIPIPPIATAVPTSLSELDLLELGAMAGLLRLLCGRSVSPLKQPERKALCVLAAVLDYEYYHRGHPDHTKPPTPTGPGDPPPAQVT